MNSEAVIVERTYNAPIANVWKALTDKDEMRKWYFDLADFRAEVGFEFEFWGGSDTQQYLHKCKVLEVQEGKKLTYSWQYDGYEGYSEVTFELIALNDNLTFVKVMHTGLDSFPAETYPDFAKDNFKTGWTHIINVELLAYLEK